MKATRIVCSALLALGSSFAASGAMAAGPTSYQRAVCDGVMQDRAACIREGGAARQAAQTGALTTPSPDSALQNALARCQNQPAEDQRACQDRVRGTGVTAIDGSVLGGGAIRETVTPVPVAATPLPAASPIPLTPTVAPMPRPMPPPPVIVPAPATVIVVPAQ
ncbi:hypothetical protein QTI66_20345 [Variovorax sp. J22R133]|uniref:hypothetical protein n=1 Tax=Variovorax brevis TaxID=3053503 RepID=UPI00257520B8|nr:hypothetical protein [Variovorax sp. J22R133]MDM0114514.1 hypothetical protein [Variovorax sp. J22R133]